MCAKMLSCCHRKCMRASHRTDSFSFFFPLILSHFILSKLDDTSISILCTLVVSFWFCLDHLRLSFFLPSLLTIPADPTFVPISYYFFCLPFPTHRIRWSDVA